MGFQMRINTLFFVFSLSLIVGCASVSTMKTDLTRLHGHPIEEVVRYLGDPSGYVELPSYKIYTWVNSENLNLVLPDISTGDGYTVDGDYVTTTNYGTKTSSTDLVCKISVRTDPSGTITSTEINGDGLSCAKFEKRTENIAKSLRFSRSGETVTFKDGSSYTGDVKDGILDGFGTYTYADGRTYTGEFKNNRKHGEGHLKSPTGGSYEGQFVEGLYHGKGIFTWSNGQVYVGDFERDQQHGFGVFSQKDGSSFEGVWSRGKIHGGVLRIDPDGTMTFSFYENGEIIENKDINRSEDRGSIEVGIASYLYQKNDFPEGKSQSTYWFEKAANNGNDLAQLVMGVSNLDNPTVAIEWLRKSSAQGNSEAKEELEKLLTQTNNID